MSGIRQPDDPGGFVRIPLLTADYLNKHCHCSTLDKQKLEYPRYFSDQPHFLAPADLEKIRSFIAAYEASLNAPNARAAFGNSIEAGIFNSYDFHIGPQGPQLIEINTNAAGAVLGLHAMRNPQSCCEPFKTYRFDENRMVAMFHAEFARRFPGTVLKKVAIVDENPAGQFFYPEFLLTRDMLRRHGIDAVVAAPESLVIRENKVYVQTNLSGAAESVPVDFIYNRLTDFAFEKSEHAVLRKAFEESLATVSPNPAVHARYARKSNLAAFWSQAFDKVPGIGRMRAHIPESRLLTEENRDMLWSERKQWFFKPVNGFGGKAVYRGDKLTTRVWTGINPGEYIAQKYIPPATRQLKADLSLKYDLRVYTYGAEILGMLARYYQGQTTNFRTEHGGLACVMLAA
jgi:hypothetical protein